MVYKRTAAGVETLVRDELSPQITNAAVGPIDWTMAAAGGGAMAVDDRIVVKLYGRRISGPTSFPLTTYFEGSTHASQIQTTISAGSVGATGPQGVAGATGPTGPQGPQGPTGGPLASCEVSRLGAAQSLLTTQWNAVTWDTLVTHGPAPSSALWSGANPTRLYADRDGWWLLSANLGFSASGGGTVRMVGA